MLVLGALSASTAVRVHRAISDGSRHRYLACGYDGEVILGVRDDHLDWGELARLVEVPLRRVAPDAVHVMVSAGRPVISVTDLWQRHRSARTSKSVVGYL